MQVCPTELPDALVLYPTVHEDERGFFLESYNERDLRDLGVTTRFVQDNHSRSRKRTVRGLHLQRRCPQGKLIRATQGEILDVAVDVRRGSPTFGHWVGTLLSADNFKLFYIPAGFAHGFCVLSDVADIQYKRTDYYDPGGELSIAWNDPDIGIDWPIDSPVLSDRDACATSPQKIAEKLVYWISKRLDYQLFVYQRVRC